MARIPLLAVRLTAANLFFLLLSLPAFSDSQIRIVRLSYVEGSVQIDRGTGHYEKTMVNLPIVQGTKLRAMGDGRAEVEFEDGSTLRLTPGTVIEFPRLSLRDSGGKSSTVEVKKGTAYVDYAGSKNDEFTIQFAQQTVKFARSARVRVGIADEDAAVAVLKGEIQIAGPSGMVEVKKNQTGTFDLLNDESYKLSKSIEPEPFDGWDKQQSDFHLRYASNSYNSYSPYAYGTSDLRYYGNFFNAPGYGMMWQPYFVGAGWDPFMDGAWAFSSGGGFGWVSAYPWGWTPYHYGNWAFVPGYGWAWQPGGVWTSWYAQPRVLNPPKGFVAPQAPSAGKTTVVVSRGPSSMRADHSGSKVVIRNNSAGLGIRRGEVNNLAKVSHQVQERGAVTQHVHTAPVAQTPVWGSPQTGGSSGPWTSSPGPSLDSPQRGQSAPARMPMPPSSPAPSGGGNRHR